MTPRLTANRRRVLRAGSVRLAQGGTAARGVIVATGIVAALVLQLAGPRLQCRLADLMGIDALAPSAPAVMAPASAPGCGSPSGANPMHPCKVAAATSAIVGTAPVI